MGKVGLIWILLHFVWNIFDGNAINLPEETFLTNAVSHFSHRLGRQNAFNLGPCKVVLNRDCPHPEVKYFLYSRQHPQTPQEIGLDASKSNISQTSFDRELPTKIIIHGYNSDMFLNALVEIKNQYLMREDMNIFAIDWGTMAQGPCYPAAVWNSRIAGKCSALLVDRLRDLNVENIHVIGFSLGAHVSGFLANALEPYKLSRITGLDPAMPGFSAVDNYNKLDPSDAKFVDVIHTNAFFQGQIEQSGHVDFYLNGGVVQPGCWADDRFLACNHHRAPFYFAESINSEKGFWGWSCPNYFSYLVGRCRPHDPQTIMGEWVSRTIRGMHLVITDSVSPFAVGKFNGPTIDILKDQYEKSRLSDFDRYRIAIGDCLDDNGFDCHEELGGQNAFSDEFLEDLYP